MSAADEIPFRRHSVEWTPEKVGRFWAWLSSVEHADYFAKAHGQEVLRFAARHGALKGPALDFGCGPGFLIEHLLRANVPTMGLDLSRESLAAVEQRFAGRTGFMGVHHAEAMPSSLEAGQFALVFLLETVEHLTEKQLDATLLEARRLLTQDGVIVITTPNEERLEDRTVMCPDCGCEFHRVQHVRSFSRASLSRAVEQAGFRVAAVEARSLGANSLRHRAREALHRFVRGKKGLNLLLMARRRS